MTFQPAIARLDRDVVLFPVRHHSPAAARLLEQAVTRVRPRALLIEGPADFNASWAELQRPHQLPIAIYSYAAWSDGERSGAFYPFCVYSPEWRAIELAREHHIPAAFIDLPWVELARTSQRQHAYADGEERRATYVTELLERLGLESFDDLWDRFFEVDHTLSLEHYLARCHELMFHIRHSQPVPEEDRQREAFMAQRIQAALAEHGAPVLAVTGAYHSWALFAGPEPAAPIQPEAVTVTDRGIALTPYSYERLDALTGYQAGLPHPGFYHRMWLDRRAGTSGDSFHTLLGAVAQGVRERKQPLSAADLIAIDALARGLAALRGQSEPWRRELVDGIRGAAIKDDLIGGHHPLLDVVASVLRGNERGRLAAGTTLPPLVADIEAAIQEHQLTLPRKVRQLTVDLTRAEELPRARALHRLQGLGIAGFTRLSGGRITQRADLTQVIETWSLEWSEEFAATCIERSVYGVTLAEASQARLVEEAHGIQRSAGRAAGLLLEASLQGHFVLARDFSAGLIQLIRDDSGFSSVGDAVNTLLYLYRYDDLLQAGTREAPGELLREAYQRGLWLAEAMTHAAPPPHVEEGLGLLRETLERCGVALGLHREEFVDVFTRVAAHAVSPWLRGCATGLLWSLAALPVEQITLPLTALPEELGDFLGGLFALAREAAQRHPELVERIDHLLQSFSDEAFLEALPALRLAFSPFTPREKHHLVRTLLGGAAPTERLVLDPSESARLLAWESRIFETLARYGVRP